MRGMIRFVLGSGLMLLGTVLAQQNAAHGNYTYDSAKQVKVTGTVQEVRNYQCPVSGTVGAHITIKQGGETIEVHLAPATFLKQYDIVIKQGDVVEIQGSKILFEGKPSLIAKLVIDDQVTYAFRDASGKPLW